LAFEDIDWSGLNDRLIDPLADVHPYPARFIEVIPDALLARFARPGARVLDPFCGSGTTLVRAARAGHRAVGVDLHPIACLMTRVKTRCYRPRQLDAIERVGMLPIAHTRFIPEHLKNIPRVDHWFSKEVQAALTAITSSIFQHSNEWERDVLLCALSRIIVRVSRQESDTRYAAIENNYSYDTVMTSYHRSVSEVCRALRSAPFSDPIDVRVINADIFDVSPDAVEGPFDLVITSPPYPNAYEYWLYHKYRMYWLGFDPIAVRSREIGARPHYFKKDPQTAADFEIQMSALFGLLAKVTTHTAPLCFVISDSIIHGKPIDNRALMTRSARAHGYRLCEATVRHIPSGRKAFNPTVSPRDEEHVLVFERAQQESSLQ
jgi:site-specific DNA-methyltransferase (cytosine-N4-specific)